MRLLNTKTLKLEEFVDENEVSYVILSHRWGKEEISLQQLVAGGVDKMLGYLKIQEYCRIAAGAGFQYAWIDTCCIDKTSSAELSEAINSMYRWYQKAEMCYTYLSDVEALSDINTSVWFTRGWTLQELLAPKLMTFYNCRWEPFSSKEMLAQELSRITGIPHHILRGSRPLSDCCVAERMSWASKRVTTRLEDRAYCLIGLFDVNMPLLYGEGENAFRRLQEEIIRTTHDHSIFAWSYKDTESPRGLLATSPEHFVDCSRIRLLADDSKPEPYSMTNSGLSIEFQMLPWAMDIYLTVLRCTEDVVLRPHPRHLPPRHHARRHHPRVAIFLRQTNHTGQFFRVAFSGRDILLCKRADAGHWMKLRRIFILLRAPPLSIASFSRGMMLYGFVFLQSSFGFDFRHLKDQGASIINGRNPPESCDTPRGWMVKLLPGQHGTVAWIDFTGTRYDHGNIGLLKLGFDFEFNPVCKLWTSQRLDEHRLGQRRGEAVETSLLDNNDWIDKDVALEGIEAAWAFPEISGPLRPTYAFRGHNTSGLWARIPALGLAISIQKILPFVEGPGFWSVEMENIGIQETQLTNVAHDLPHVWLSKEDFLYE